MAIWKTPLLLSLLILLSTQGCSSLRGAPIVKVEVQPKVVPESLLNCHDDPEPPAKPRVQRDSAVYIAELKYVLRLCRDSIEDVREWNRLAIKEQQ